MDELKDFETFGFLLYIICKEARENGLEDLACEIERRMANVQTCYDMVAQKWTATGKEPWKLDVAELKARLK